MFRLVAIALTVSGVVAGSAARADEAEARAVAFVKSLGGMVARDDKAPGKPVVVVYLAGRQVTDAGLNELAPLKNLTQLRLNHTEGTGAELQKTLPKCKIIR